MKKALLLISFFITVHKLQAQRFFYLQSNLPGDQSVKNRLVQASQFISPTALMSDYTIETAMGYQEKSNIITFQLVMQDSATFKTIFKSNEEYAIGTITAQSPYILRTAYDAFIEKNIEQIIYTATREHFEGLVKYLKAKKDKT